MDQGFTDQGFADQGFTDQGFTDRGFTDRGIKPERPLARTELLLGAEGMERLRSSRVAVFGLGGVGSYVCEALVRSGVGAFDLIDSDRVSVSNLNRQILATRETLGRYKAEVMGERMRSICPEAEIRTRCAFFLPETADAFPFGEYDYVVDAVDTVTAKIEIVLRSRERGVPVISCMGTGNKLDGGRFRVSDLYETRVCPLARIMRKELRKRGVPSLKVVWSDEPPLSPPGYGTDTDGHGTDTAECGIDPAECPPGRRSVPGSLAFVTGAAGLLLAGEVVRDLAGIIPAAQAEKC